MHKLKISTKKREQIIDITPSVSKYLCDENCKSGIVVVYSPHTTAALTVNENADPDVKRDMEYFLSKTVPQQYGFNHAEGNSDAHIKGSLMGFSCTFIVESRMLRLGTWQGIYLMEFDGPRTREVWLKFIAD